MAHISLFRKYRSQDFADLSGQVHITSTLRNALKTDRVAQAYLFCGPRGTGKTSSARILAKALNCKGPDPAHPRETPAEEPCGRCAPCVAITAGSFMDVTEIDAASYTGIDNIREVIISKADFPPVEGRRKIYVIDEVHKLSNSAFNALLKTLEEPPPHLVFILATTDPQNVPATILSRCQRFDFKRISQRDIHERLQHVSRSEGFEVDDEALVHIAEASDGGMRDALVLLEQAAAFGEGRITSEDVRNVLGMTDRRSLFDLTTHLVDGDVAAALALLDEMLGGGRDLVQMARDLLGHFRGLLVSQASGPRAAEILKTTAEHAAGLAGQAARIDPQALMAGLKRLTRLADELKDPSHVRLKWEMALVQVADALRGVAPLPRPAGRPPAEAPAPARPSSDPAIADLLKRLQVLEEKMRAGGAPPTGSPQGPAVYPAAGPPPTGSPQGPAVYPAAGPPPTGSPPGTGGPPRPAGVPTGSAPGPVQGPAPPQAGPPLDLAALAGAWRTLLEGLKREKKAPLRALLIEAFPLAIEGSTFVVGIDQKYSGFHLEKIQASRQEVAERLGQILRRPMGFDVRVHGGPPPAVRPGPPPQAPRSSEEQHRSFVQEGLDVFEGKIM